MGWFWDSKGGSDPESSTGDAYSKLDPALRDFLDKESPLKYEDTHPKPRVPQEPSRSPDGAQTTYRSQIGLQVPGVSQSVQDSARPSGGPAVPPESLYQDGRYADLWKNYRTQADIDATAKTDQDKLTDVVEAFKDRRAAIGRAALENCVLEQMTEKDCFSHGGWRQKMTMCRTENRAFNRCYTMQSRFLKALGYLSSSHRSEEEEERIQLHADKLYHEMLAREKAAEEANAAGQEAPTFTPLISAEATTAALGEDSAWARARRTAQAEGLPSSISDFPPDKQKEIRERIKGLEGTQRELELQLIAAETRAGFEYAVQIRDHFEEERVHRAERRERGRESVGDSIKRLAGWDK